MLEIEDTYCSIIKVKDYSATTHETGLPMKTSLDRRRIHDKLIPISKTRRRMEGKEDEAC
jgi:hypothetical protein